jgi:pilus assembly protein FimV
VLEQRRVLQRIDPADAQGGDPGRGQDAQAEVDQRRREGALVLVRERADRGEDGQAEEGQADRPRVAEGEAVVGGERQAASSGSRGWSGWGGSGSSGAGVSGPVGVSGASGPGVGSAGTTGASGTTGCAGSAGWGTSSVAMSRKASRP